MQKIIFTQDLKKINNFNILYDYSNITDMSHLWERIEEIINKKEKLEEYLRIYWKKIKFPTLDMTNVEKRENIFQECPLYEINLINTHKVKDFTGRFEETKNLEKISLDLSSCEYCSFIFHESNVKKCELKNTQKINNIDSGFKKTKNLENISLDLSGCENRNHIFWKSEIREVELLNTQNIEKFSFRFCEAKNLEKINNLYLDNCKILHSSFKETNLKEINLYNTGKVKDWYGCFRETKIEEIELDINSRENREYMFCENKNLKKINLKNCENIKKMKGFIRGCENLDYLEMNISNMENMNNFIDEKNKLKYLKLIGLEEYIKKIKSNFVKNEKLEKNGEINIEKYFCDIFFTKDEIKEKYQKNPIPYINLVKLTKKTNYDIIANDLEDFEVKKILKEKQRKENSEKIKIEKLEGVKNIQKEIYEINL